MVQPHAELDIHFEINFDKPADYETLTLSFFFTQDFLTRLKREPIHYPKHNISFAYLGMEKTNSPIGFFNCYKIEYTIGEYPNQIKGTKYVEENRGIIIKNVYYIPGSGKVDLAVSQTNIIQGARMSPVQSVTSSGPDITKSAAVGGSLGVITHVVAKTASSTSFVGEALSGVAQLSSMSVLGPAVLGGFASGMVTEIAQDTFNVGPIETVVASATVGTAVTVAAATLATGIVPGVLAIGALFTASLVFGLFDYYLF